MHRCTILSDTSPRATSSPARLCSRQTSKQLLNSSRELRPLRLLMKVLHKLFPTRSAFGLGGSDAFGKLEKGYCPTQQLAFTTRVTQKKYDRFDCGIKFDFGQTTLLSHMPKETQQEHIIAKLTAENKDLRLPRGQNIVEAIDRGRETGRAFDLPRWRKSKLLGFIPESPSSISFDCSEVPPR